jgi:hypothetical protein
MPAVSRTPRRDGGIADSIATVGSVTSAAAAAFPASFAPTVGGVFRLRVTVIISGTAETLPTNLRLRNNGVTISDLPTVPGSNVYEFPRVTIAGAIDTRVTATAVVGSIYTVQLTATRVE